MAVPWIIQDLAFTSFLHPCRIAFASVIHLFTLVPSLFHIFALRLYLPSLLHFSHILVVTFFIFKMLGARCWDDTYQIQSYFKIFLILTRYDIWGTSGPLHIISMTLHLFASKIDRMGASKQILWIDFSHLSTSKWHPFHICNTPIHINLTSFSHSCHRALHVFATVSYIFVTSFFYS